MVFERDISLKNVTQWHNDTMTFLLLRLGHSHLNFLQDTLHHPSSPLLSPSYFNIYYTTWPLQFRKNHINSLLHRRLAIPHTPYTSSTWYILLHPATNHTSIPSYTTQLMPALPSRHTRNPWHIPHHLSLLHPTPAITTTLHTSYHYYTPHGVYLLHPTLTYTGKVKKSSCLKIPHTKSLHIKARILMPTC